MAIAPVFYNGMISSTPDIANIRMADDAKAAAMQVNSESEVQQEAEEHVNQVRDKDNADGAESESDASGGSRNEYAGDGGARRRKKGDSFGKMVKKQQGGFSISI
ncbi:MAG: hypothetical protein IJ075_06080 [Lachnospiraceae bacterium]|nr:hypothetical protein [Lachnospiraceae bacterium]MBQ9607598.1 hypothetical protein [Lachnospiraceae bacterium]